MTVRARVCCSLVLGLIVLLSAGCDLSPRRPAYAPRQPIAPPLAPPIGVHCAIELKPPLPSGLNELWLKGRLKGTGVSWLELTPDDGGAKGDVWIPRDSVLWIVTGKSADAYKGISFKW